MTQFEEIEAIMLEATKVRNQISKDREIPKLGLAHGGSSGAIKEDGRAFYAGCGRLSQARLLGAQADKTESDYTMFAGGFALEDYLEESFINARTQFTKEEEKEALIGGIKVSGRADFRIQLGGSVVGVEVKSLASPFSAIKSVKNKFPFVKHLVQACTYMLLWDEQQWLVAIGNTFIANERGFKVESGIRWYVVRRCGEEFSCENQKGEVTMLPFTAKDIERYYQQLKAKTEAKVLMSRPTELEINVDTYKRCKYCFLEGACNSVEVGQIGFAEWVERAKG